MRKQILLFLMMLLPLVASAAYDIAVVNSDSVTIYYKWINDGKELAVTQSSGLNQGEDYVGSVVIPDSVTYEGATYPVTCIKARAFVSSSRLTSVSIPSSMKTIEEGAFAYCYGLTSIEIPDGVTSIGKSAFSECGNLTSVVLPDGLTSILDETFYGCHRLSSINIPEGVTSIGRDAFNRCDSLTSITIPSSLTKIEKYAFFKCTGLKKVVIKDIAAWCSINFVGSDSNPLSIAKHIYSDEDTEIKKLVIPEGVTSIGNNAFSGCDSLNSVLLPYSLTNIGEFTFYGCNNVTFVMALNPTPVAISQGTFTNRANAKLYVIVGSKEAYQAADYWKEFMEIIEIDVTGIDQIANNKKNNSTIFSLDGKRSNKPQRGINIINGKKVVVK